MKYIHKLKPVQIVAAQPGTRAMYHEPESPLGYFLEAVTCYALCRVKSVCVETGEEEDQWVAIYPCDIGLNGSIEPIAGYDDYYQNYIGLVMAGDDADEVFLRLRPKKRESANVPPDP